MNPKCRKPRLAAKMSTPNETLVAADASSVARGLRVEVADHQPGQPEGHRHRHEDGDAQREDRAQVAEEDEQREEHQRDADQRRAGHVVEDGFVLGDEERKTAGEPDAQLVALQLGFVAADDGLHAIDHRAGLVHAQAGAGGPHEERYGAAVGRDHEPVDVVLERLAQVLQRDEERPVVHVPVADGGHARLDAADLGAHGEEVARQRQRQRHRLRLLQAVGALEGFDHHQHVPIAADAPDQLLHLPHRRHVRGEQLLEAGTDLEAGGQLHRGGHDGQRDQQHAQRPLGREPRHCRDQPATLWRSSHGATPYHTCWPCCAGTTSQCTKRRRR